MSQRKIDSSIVESDSSEVTDQSPLKKVRTDDQVDIHFGCIVSSDYSLRYVISDTSCLRVRPDGYLSLSSTGLAFSKVYSSKRLLPQYCKDLNSDIKSWLNDSRSSVRVLQTSKSISKYIQRELVSFLMNYLFDQLYQELQSLDVLNLIKTKLDASLISRALEDILALDVLRKQSGDNTALVSNLATSIALNIPLSSLLTRKHDTVSPLAGTPTYDHETATLMFSLFLKIIKEKGALFSSLVCTKVLSLLEQIFDEKTAQLLFPQLLNEADQKNGIFFIAEFIKHNKRMKQHFYAVFCTHLDKGLSHSSSLLEQAIQSLQKEMHPELESSDVEKQLITQLEKSLTPNELAILEAQKVSIIATDQPLSSHPRCKGIFNPVKNTIYIGVRTIGSSLIHEVQHSLGFDISPTRCFQFFKFHHQCKKTHISLTHGLTSKMEDIKQVLDLEQSHNPISAEDALMINRAKYILTLYNYPSSDRTREVLAHLRQFIADFGAEKTKLLLPKLFNYWKNEILNKSVQSKVSEMEHYPSPKPQ